jgi:hypothetical protein
MDHNSLNKKINDLNEKEKNKNELKDNDNSYSDYNYYKKIFNNDNDDFLKGKANKNKELEKNIFDNYSDPNFSNYRQNKDTFALTEDEIEMARSANNYNTHYENEYIRKFNQKLTLQQDPNDLKQNIIMNNPVYQQNSRKSSSHNNLVNCQNLPHYPFDNQRDYNADIYNNKWENFNYNNANNNITNINYIHRPEKERSKFNTVSFNQEYFNPENVPLDYNNIYSSGYLFSTSNSLPHGINRFIIFYNLI